MTFGEGNKFTATGRKKVATVRSVQIKVANSSITDEICMELDSHADTCILVKECLKVYYWNFPVNVSAWNPKDRERLCQTILGAVSYDHHHSGRAHIFIFHPCTHVNHLEHHMLCPMQCRMNSVGVK